MADYEVVVVDIPLASEEANSLPFSQVHVQVNHSHGRGRGSHCEGLQPAQAGETGEFDQRIARVRGIAAQKKEIYVSHGFLYYTRTDFMPLADSQNKGKIYSVFLYPIYSSLISIHL